MSNKELNAVTADMLVATAKGGLARSTTAGRYSPVQRRRVQRGKCKGLPVSRRGRIALTSAYRQRFIVHVKAWMGSTRLKNVGVCFSPANRFWPLLIGSQKKCVE